MNNVTNIRLGYFDALRGMAIFLVVIHHVILHSIGIENGINVFLRSFFMPLFFFISGFFVYKTLDKWNRYQIRNSISRKFKVQIIGASIFLSLYLIFVEKRLPNHLSFLYPQGYWFTFVLFRLFIGYIIIVGVSKIICNKMLIVFWILLISSTLVCIMIDQNYLEFVEMFRWPSLLESLFSRLVYKEALYYFPYYAIGIIARANIDKFEKVMSNDSTKIISFLSIIIIWALIYLNFIKQPHDSSLLFLIRCLLTLTFIIQFFYNFRRIFEKNTAFGKTIRLIGRRTLDIYFIHYFFLPDLHFLKPYLIIGNPVFLQVVIGLSVSIIIVGISILVGQLIRMSPLLAEWLLGVKR